MDAQQSLLVSASLAAKEFLTLTEELDELLACLPNGTSAKLKSALADLHARMADASGALRRELERPHVDHESVGLVARLGRNAAKAGLVICLGVAAGASQQVAEVFLNEKIQPRSESIDASVRALEACIAEFGRPGGEQPLSEDELALLAASSDHMARAAVAQFTTDQTILEKLAADGNGHVRRTAVGRIRNPALLARMTADSNKHVREAAVARSSLLRLEPGEPKPTGESRAILAMEAAGTDEVRWLFALADDWHVRASAARGAVATDLLDRLLRDGASEVRRAIARNPRATVGQLRHLADDDDRKVRGAAKRSLRERNEQ